MPYDLYVIRLIHRAFPGERLWTATQLTGESVVRFLRSRNRGAVMYISDPTLKITTPATSWECPGFR